ncbi:MAG: HAD family hydrolase [Bradymonadales bacterium]
MKTLVLDLDETLIFSTMDDLLEGGVQLTASEQVFYTAFRPGLRPFLKEMSKLFECYIWTTGQPSYLAAVWDYIGVEGYHLWARDKCKRITDEEVLGDPYEKPLSLICDDLSDIVIVDNTYTCFAKTPLNGILVRTWRGDPDDCELEHLAHYLRWLKRQEKMQRKHKLWRFETLAMRSAAMHNI